MIEYKLLDSKSIDLDKVEDLRRNAYGINSNLGDTIYKKGVEDGNMLLFGALLDNELVGAAYISDSLNSLYIENIFVRKDLQDNQELHIGRNLMNFIIKNKELVEDYYGKSFYRSKLENRDNENFYQKLGYSDDNNALETMSRRI